MTDDAPLTPEDQDDALAAELALGLLDGEEARTAVARLASDPAFAQAVNAWQERLAGLAEGLTPVMAPARARQGIREKLGHVHAPLAEAPGDRRRPIWRSPLWAVGGLLGAAALAAVLWLPGRLAEMPPPAQPTYQAELVSEDQALRVAARLEENRFEIALEQGAAASGRDYEIWWVTPNGSAPISLGLVPRAGSAQLTLPEGLAPGEGVKIALSDEPEGGSPTGQATGPIVAIADLTSL